MVTSLIDPAMAARPLAVPAARELRAGSLHKPLLVRMNSAASLRPVADGATWRRRSVG